MKEKMITIFLIITIIICLPIIFVSSVILIDAFAHPDEIPSFFGWKPFIVLSGSMKNEFDSGDLIIVKEVKNKMDLEENQIIAFRLNNVVITHRIIDIDQKFNITTRGDINSDEDEFKISFDNVEGIYRYKIKGLGNIALFIQSPTGMILCLGIPIVILFVLQAVQNHKYRKRIEQLDI